MLTVDEVTRDRRSRRRRLDGVTAVNERLFQRSVDVSRMALTRIRKSQETLARGRACLAKARAATTDAARPGARPAAKESVHTGA